MTDPRETIVSWQSSLLFRIPLIFIGLLVALVLATSIVLETVGHLSPPLSGTILVIPPA